MAEPSAITSELERALCAFADQGCLVEHATDIPRLYHIDNGPELTERQVVDFARQKGLL